MASSFGLCGFEDTADLICNIRRYIYAVPAIVTFFLGIIFNICGALEKK